jgi:translation initiation factor IF-2
LKNLKLNIKNTQLASALSKAKPGAPKEGEKGKADEAAAPKKKSRLVQSAPLTPEPAAVQPEPTAPSAEPVKVEAGPPSPPTPQAPPSPAPKLGPVLPAPKEKPAEPQLGPVLPRKEPPKDLRLPKKVEQRGFDGRDRQGLRNIDDEAWRKRRSYKAPRAQMEEAIVRPKSLKVRLPMTIKDLAQAMKLKGSQLIAKLFMRGMPLTLNDYLDDETVVQMLGLDFDCEISLDTSEAVRMRVTDKTIRQEITEAPLEKIEPRAPVVAFMGHVDHGKTSLIDSIRKSNRVAGEAGAITQHIGAFRVKTTAGDIAILDTPGHEAFTEMRSRGANVTDIVILVVAGDEGIKAQTEEAIRQAREAKVPLLVAINKADKPNFDLQKIYRELADRELLPESWGGPIITVSCSAVTGQGIPELLEMIALQAEVLELRANPEMRARGAIIESEMHKGLGAVATVLVQNGTLRKNDAILFGHEFARIKTMQDDQGRQVEEAGPSVPVKITGLSNLATAGDEFIVVKNEKEAKELAEARADQAKHTLAQAARISSLERMMQKKEGAELKILPVILRADVQGSLEALKNSLLKIQSKKVRLEIVNEGVGEISESDVELAAASKSTLIGFHTRIESHAEDLIKIKKVSVCQQDVIYHLVDDVKALMKGLLDRIEKEIDIGSVLVKAVFKSSQLGLIAGCQVTDGLIKRTSHIRQIRGKQQIWKGKIGSLKKVKEDVKEVAKGHECGILLDGQTDIQENDILQAYDITYLEQEL